MKNRNGTLAGGDLYEDCMAIIKGSEFVNSESSRDQSVILAAVRNSSDGIIYVD
jgi:hypothetical protein